jgi:hypothetical protein
MVREQAAPNPVALILEEAIDAVLRRGTDAVYDAAKRAKVVRLLPKRPPDAAELRASVSRVVFPMLVTLDPKEAVAFALRVLEEVRLVERRKTYEAIAAHPADLVFQAAAKSCLRTWSELPAEPRYRWPSVPLVERYATPGALVDALGAGLGQANLRHVYDPLLAAVREEAKRVAAQAGTRPAKRGAPSRAPAIDEQLSALDSAARWVLDQALAEVPLAALPDGVLGDTQKKELVRRPELATPELRTRALLDAVGPLRSTHPNAVDGVAVEACLWLIDRAGEDRSTAAIPVLRHLWESRDERFTAAAARALDRIGTPEARASLAAVLDLARRGEVELGHHEALLAIGAAISADPSTSATRLAPFFATESLATPSGRRVADQLLGIRPHDVMQGRRPEPLFEKDQGWLDLGARLLGDRRVNAREFLGTFDAGAVGAALERAGWKPPAPRARVTKPVPANPRWLERYRAGEHEAVWREIRELEDSVREPAARKEAQAVAAEMMGRARENIERIIATLQAKKYPFDAKSAKRALVPPDAKSAKAIAAMEKLLGGPLPIALRAFYEAIGGVTLMEAASAGKADDPSIFAGYGELDPLVVAPPATALEALQEEAKENERFPPVLRAALTNIYLGYGALAKADRSIEDDDPYTLRITGEGADGTVLQRGMELPFVDYLRRCLQAGGFLRLPDQPADATRRQRKLLTDGFVPF